MNESINPSSPSIAEAQSPVRKKTSYSTTDSVFAWLSFVFAFLFCHVVPVVKHPLGGFLLIYALFITAFIILGIKKIRLTASCVLTSISALLLAVALLLTESGFLVWLAYIYCLANFLFLIYAAFGNRVESGFSDFIYIDFIKILFILPFCSILSIFPAIANESTKKGSWFVLKILIGLGIAIVPTALVFAFLSYDDGFLKILDDIFSFDAERIPQFLYSLMFTVPYAMYGYGLYASSQKGVLQNRIRAENCKTVLQKVKILPQITAVVTVAPILFLYVVFFISQWQYYVSGFTGVLPEDFSYAEYARHGFFQLCAVSLINLLLIAGISVFIHRGAKNKAVVLKLLTIVFCLFTLILISTAVAKLVMYIDYYGLTQKRIYAMWLMVLIAIVFLVIALGQFLSKIRIVAVSLSIFIVMFTALSLCNVNALTAKYNTDRYLSGTLETIDTEAMEDLGDSAVPSLVKAVTQLDTRKDQKLKISIDVILYDKVMEMKEEKFSVFSFNLPDILARSALKHYDPIIPPVGAYTFSSMSVDGDLELWSSDDEVSLVINADRTGQFFFEGKAYDISIQDNRLICGEEECTFMYSPAEDDQSACLTLYWTSEEGQFANVILLPVEKQ